MTALQSLCRQISRFEWLILLLLFPFVLFLTPDSAPFLLLFPLLWLIRRIGSGRFFPPTPLNWPLHLLLFMGVVSLFVTFDIDNSLPMVGGLIFGISFYYALAAFGGHSRRALYLALAAFILAGAGVTFLGLVHPIFLNRLAFFQPLSDAIPAVLLQFPGDADGFSPNRLSGTLLWVAPLTWVLAVTGMAGDRETFPGWLAAVLTILFITLALLMSLTLTFLFSRAAQVSFFVIMVLLYGLLAWKHKWLFVVAALVILAGSLFLASSETYRLRATQFLLILSGETTSGSTPLEAFSGRTEVWERAFYTVRDFPLTGVGLNNFQEVMLTYYPPLTFRSAEDITHAHNQLLIVGTDLGLPGLIAYIALMLGTATMLWQSWRRAAQRPQKILALGFGASLLAFQIFGLFDGIGLGEKPAVFFWFLTGLSAALHNLSVTK